MYGQKGVDGGSKWREGTRETEVRLDGCEAGIGQQRNDGGGSASMRERSERVESTGKCLTELVSRCHFCLALCSFGPPPRALVVITRSGEGCRYIMRLRKTVKRAQLPNTKSQMSSIWAKLCMLMIICVLFDLTRVPFLAGGRKSWDLITCLPVNHDICIFIIMPIVFCNLVSIKCIMYYCIIIVVEI